MVAPFVGQTAIKTQEVVESAVGGMLFVDEAYALVKDAKDSFGKEALDTLIKVRLLLLPFCFCFTSTHAELHAPRREKTDRAHTKLSTNRNTKTVNKQRHRRTCPSRR